MSVVVDGLSCCSDRNSLFKFVADLHNPCKFERNHDILVKVWSQSLLVLMTYQSEWSVPMSRRISHLLGVQPRHSKLDLNNNETATMLVDITREL